MMVTDTLFELWDFEPAMKPARPIPPETYSCGVHQLKDGNAHWHDCLGGRCPCCGTERPNADSTNHAMDAGRQCTSQWLRINHLYRAALVLDGNETPGTNCFAVAHFGAAGHAPGGYMRKGIPIECVALEYCELWEWLTTHNVPASALQPVTSASGIDLVARMRREHSEAVRKAYSE